MAGFTVGFISIGIGSQQVQATDFNSPQPQNIKKAVEKIAPYTSVANVNTENATLAVLADDDYIEKPLVARTEVTTQPKSAKKTKIVKTSKSTTNNSSGQNLTNGGSGGFPWGWCTWYVASKKSIPWHGNAGTWLAQAQNYGFATGSEPRVGAVIVTSESWFGHVGIVDGVDGDNITISEMNFAGFGRVSTRTIAKSFGKIKGYIY